MGAAESSEVSSLDICVQDFQNPIVGTFNLNSYKVYVIKDHDEAAAKEACKLLESKDTLYIDCEGHYFGSRFSELGVVQIATPENCCYLFDIKTFPEALDYLRPILESNSIKKVFHDCSGDIAALYNEAEIVVSQPIIDIQLTQQVADARITGESKVYCLSELYEYLLNEKFPSVKVKTVGIINWWTKCRPLTEDALIYAAIDVLTLPLIYQEQNMRYKLYNERYENEVEKRRFCQIANDDRHLTEPTINLTFRAEMPESRSAATEQANSKKNSQRQPSSLVGRFAEMSPISLLAVLAVLLACIVILFSSPSCNK